MKLKLFQVLALVCLVASSLAAQNLYQPMPFIKPQFSYSNGVPVANGFVCAFASGTTNKLDTYSTPNGSPNTDPVQLDPGGRAWIYLQLAAYTLKLYAPGTGNVCNNQVVGALLWSADNVFTNDFAQVWTPSVIPLLDFQETGATHAHGTHQPTSTDFKNMAVLDLSNPASNGKQALYINTKQTSSSGARNVTGLWIDSYTLVDNGGDVSGLHIVDTGAGDAASFFHLASERPSGYALPTGGYALEMGVDHGSLGLFSIKDNVLDGVPFTGQGLIFNMFTQTSTSGIPAINVVNKLPNTGAGQLAFRAGDDAGMDNRFTVNLDTGQTFIKGQVITHSSFALDTNGNGIYWPALTAASQPYILHNGTTGQLEFKGGNGSGSGGTIAYNFLVNGSSASLLQILTAGGLAIPRTSTQILFGTTPNTSVANFPVPSGGVQIDFPSVNSIVEYVDSATGRMYGNGIFAGSDFSGNNAWLNTGAIAVVESAANAAILGLTLGGGRAALFSNKTNSGTARPLFLSVAQTDVVKLETSGSDRACVYVGGSLRLLTLSGSTFVDGGACP